VLGVVDVVELIREQFAKGVDRHGDLLVRWVRVRPCETPIRKHHATGEPPHAIQRSQRIRGLAITREGNERMAARRMGYARLQVEETSTRREHGTRAPNFTITRTFLRHSTTIAQPCHSDWYVVVQCRIEAAGVLRTTCQFFANTRIENTFTF